MSIPYLIVSILIVTRACSKMPELQCYRCSRSQLRCQNYILALSRCSSRIHISFALCASTTVKLPCLLSSLLAQKSRLSGNAAYSLTLPRRSAFLNINCTPCGLSHNAYKVSSASCTALINNIQQNMLNCNTILLKKFSC